MGTTFPKMDLDDSGRRFNWRKLPLPSIWKSGKRYSLLYLLILLSTLTIVVFPFQPSGRRGAALGVVGATIPLLLPALATSTVDAQFQEGILAHVDRAQLVRRVVAQHRNALLVSLLIVVPLSFFFEDRVYFLTKLFAYGALQFGALAVGIGFISFSPPIFVDKKSVIFRL